MTKNEEITVPPGVAVFPDKRTGAKTLALPFQFPDGKNGVLMIARLANESWKPDQTIKKITIEYHEHNPTE